MSAANKVASLEETTYEWIEQDKQFWGVATTYLPYFRSWSSSFCMQFCNPGILGEGSMTDLDYKVKELEEI